MKVAIWGFGVDGQAMAGYLQKHCYEMHFDILCQPTEACGDYHFITEKVTVDLLNSYDLIIKSPGISPYLEPACSVKAYVVSSTAVWFANHKPASLIAITGTKGKSTVSCLLTHVLEGMGFNVALAGNIGRPLISLDDDYDYIVLETSSYQAYDKSIMADIAVLLNLFPEHLNWHLTESTYYKDKLKLLQKSTRGLVNFAYRKMISEYIDNTGFIEFNHQSSYHVLKGVLMYRDKPLLSAHGWKLLGDHNLLNGAAVLAVLEQLSLDIRQGINLIRSFEPLPHRLQTVTILNGVHYVDDSIASTPMATLAALTVVSVSKTWLLLGGFERGLDWNILVTELKKNPPKAIICSGQNGERILMLLKTAKVLTYLSCHDTLKEAVLMARDQAEVGDTVLLSPGAPSFDAFENYTERGRAFKQWIIG